MKYKSQRQLVTIRVGHNISIPCPELAKVIKEDGAFKSLSWYYCDPCTREDIKWWLLAGLNSSRASLVNHEGRYANRANLFQNGTLEIYSVQVADATIYRCRVKKITYTTSAFYNVTIRVDSSGKCMHICIDLVYFCGTFVIIYTVI